MIEELLHWGSIGALLTDIMPGIKSVWSVIQQRYPSIFISGCFYRIFNSLIKDIIGSDRRFARTIDDCTFVIEFIKQHREQTFHSLSESDKFLSLKPFASDWCLIAENIGRLLAVRDAIRSTGEIVVSGAGDSEHFRELVINSADFWADLNELYVTVLVPVSKIMEEARLDHSYSPSKLFGWFESFKQHQNNPEIVKSIEKHWNDYINDESMVWLLALDPFFFPQAAIIRTENNERLHRALELLFPEPSEANKAQAELVLFYEFLQNDQEMTLAGPMVAAFEWWLIFERTRFPHIANIALRLFSVPSSPALVDWIWRVFDGAISRPDLGDIDRTQLAVTYINHILACGDFKDNTYV